MSNNYPFSYAQVPLQRASAERKDTRWIESQLKRGDSRIYCLHTERNLLLTTRGQAPVAAVVMRHSANDILETGRRPVFLGMQNSDACFAVDLSHSEPSQLDLPEHSAFIDLRSVGATLEVGEASLLAYARGLVYWHKNNQYCGRCGALSYGVQGGHARKCTNNECGRESFPRTDPAVIMLVEDLSQPDKPRCLLGRNQRFAARMFSTLAGFVDPGETLEDTVAREVLEEAGIHVTNIRYQASQPWPFPASIMLGFRATAASIEIDIDADEIEEAYWFSAREVSKFGEWCDGGNNNCLPRKDSIARYLIDSWVDEMLYGSQSLR